MKLERSIPSWWVEGSFKSDIFPFELINRMLSQFDSANVTWDGGLYHSDDSPVVFSARVKAIDPIDAIIKFNDHLWKVFSLFEGFQNGKEFVMMGVQVKPADSWPEGPILTA